MTVKNKIKKDITKAELIRVITKKTAKIPAHFQPMVKRDFLVGLKYKTKPQLKHIASRMIVEVDRTGYNITIR